MNPRSFCNLPLPLPQCKASAATTLLPFLYQTRTIQCPPSWALRAQRSYRTNHSSQKAFDNHDTISDAIPFESEYNKRPNLRNNTYSDAIPFESDIPNQELDNNDPGSSGSLPAEHPLYKLTEEGSGRLPPTSTITASEKAVFDRIFKEISSNDSKETTEEEKAFDDQFEDDAMSRGDPFGDLNAIFDEALQSLKQREEKSFDFPSGERSSSIPAMSYLTAIDAFGGTNTRFLKLSEIRGDENLKKIRSSVEEHRRKVMERFDEAHTDVETWKVLETEVFPLIQRYDALRKEVEQREKKPKRKKVHAAKPDSAVAEVAENKPSPPTTQESTQEVELQAILSSNYGDYCLAAMRRLRRAFPTSPYCMNMLPTIKRLGPISHVLAASVELYNEILFLQWKEYSDLHGMADLILEMGEQGIESNEVTLKILTMVQYARRTAKLENRTMRLWWDLKPVETGWQRVSSAAKKLRHEIAKARAKSLEESEARNRLDAEGLVEGGEDLQEGVGTENETKVARAVAG